MLKLYKSVVFILPGADYETIDNSMKAEILLVNIMSALGHLVDVFFDAQLTH